MTSSTRCVSPAAHDDQMTSASHPRVVTVRSSERRVVVTVTVTGSTCPSPSVLASIVPDCVVASDSDLVSVSYPTDSEAAVILTAVRIACCLDGDLVDVITDPQP